MQFGNDIWEKVLEEMNELLEATKSKNQESIQEEFGDMLFALVNYARFIELDSENALKKATEKFISDIGYYNVENLRLHSFAELIGYVELAITSHEKDYEGTLKQIESET